MNLKKWILLFGALGVISARVFAQKALQQEEQELEQLAAAKKWDAVMLRSLDLVAGEPTAPQGYYYTALALYHQPDLDKASGFIDNVLIYGDLGWKEKARGLLQKIARLKEHFPGIKELHHFENLTGSQWYALWELDKSNINAGISAIEYYVRQGNPTVAVTILDDPEFAGFPGAKALRQRLKNDKMVSSEDKAVSLEKQGDTYFAQKKYADAKAAYEKAVAALKSRPQHITNKIKDCEDETAWQQALKENRVEAYEVYLNRNYLLHRREARAKIIDYMRARIENYAKSNEIALAEESFNKYVQQYKPARDEVKEFEAILCELYKRHIYAISDSKSRQDMQQRLDLYYKARQICLLSEADKKEISKLEKKIR